MVVVQCCGRLVVSLFVLFVVVRVDDGDDCLFVACCCVPVFCGGCWVVVCLE
jgi:hypothetical protein